MNSPTIISLKSADGQKKYKEIFDKTPGEKQITKKIRILSIFQSKLSDFSRKIRSIRKCQKIVCGNQEIVFTDSHKMEKKTKHESHAIHVFQTKLTDFIDGTLSYLKRKIRIPYKTKPLMVNTETYMEGVLPEIQISAFQTYSTFDGYLNHLFTLNPSIDEFFMNVQINHGYKPQKNYDFLNFNNIFKLEVARCKLGYTHFNSWILEFNQNESLRNELGILSRYHLDERSYLRNLNIISSHLNEYAEHLKQECRALNLIGDKIWIWDRRFFECNSNGVKRKETGKLSDPDAGHYVKKTGKYSVLTGTGYTDTCLVDRLWGLPVYWDAVSANKNDNTIFQGTVNECMKSSDFKPTFLIGDAGPDSHGSNKVVKEYEIIPVIAARRNSVGDIIKTDEGNYFRGEYIHRKFHPLLGKLYNLRTIIERRNSYEVIGYHRSEMPNRGINWAKCFISISNVTALLTALTAYKVKRFDLIRAPSAFRRLSI